MEEYQEDMGKKVHVNMKSYFYRMYLSFVKMVLVLTFVVSLPATSFSNIEKRSADMDVYPEKDSKKIYFAGGCFWGVEAYFDGMRGVLSATSGYANGKTENPSYEDVIRKNTGHAETVEVLYDPKKISLATLIERFFKVIDPVSLNRQGNDIGVQYRTGIYYIDKEDMAIIEESMEKVQKRYSKPLAVEFVPLDQYFLAEDYHQDYLEKNPKGYCHINLAAFSEEMDADKPEILSVKTPTIDPKDYSKPSEGIIKKSLASQSYAVTQKSATEPAFSGQYVDTKEKGIYVDIVTGEPLFLSTDKFDSGTGWPSFTKPIAKEVIVEHKDKTLGMVRTEVVSRVAGSHLGHVFGDGPKDSGGLRYCINSAALRFVAYKDMDKEGYGHLKALVE